MFLEFLGILVLVGFAFRLLMALAGLPFALAVVLIEGIQGQENSHRSVAVSHAFQCIVYALLLALLAATYVTWRGVAHAWVYGVAGWLWTYLMLGSNAHQKGRVTSDPLVVTQTPVQSAVSHGAAIGLAVGLVLYVIVYNWPVTLTFIPGVVPIMGVTLRLAGWLVGFWIVRIVLGFTLLAYVANFGFIVLIGGVLLLGGLWAWLRRVLVPRLRV